MDPVVYALDGVVPVIHPSAFVHQSAVLIGDVIVGPGCYVGPLASLRGDFGAVRIGAGANVQDRCVIHTIPNDAAIVEPDGHIGHGAILHGCRIRRNALVGMNAVVMDGAEVGEGAIVGAHSFVKAGARLATRSLYVGSPARLVRTLTEAEMAEKAAATGLYQQLARRCLASLHPCAPLSAAGDFRR